MSFRFVIIKKSVQQKTFFYMYPGVHIVSKFTPGGKLLGQRCLHSIIVLDGENALQSDSTAVCTRLLISLHICQQLLP